MKAVLCTMLALSVPGMGAAAEEPVPKPAEAMVEKVGENQYRIGAIELDAVTREIRFPAVVNQEDGTLEYLLVTEMGKVHESLLRTAVSPAQLQVGLKLLRYRAGLGHLVDHLWPPGKAPVHEAQGEELELLVSWAEMPGIPVRRAIQNRSTGKAMDETPWIFTGSEVIDGEFQAQAEGSIVAIYRDGFAMINSPHPQALDDENWFPLAGILPPRGAKVWVTICPWKRKP